MEVSFDGLVGPTHNYAGLSPGNLASTRHGGLVANPRAAALQGLAKMRLVAALGVPQAVLPPQPRPAVEALRRLGFAGSDADVLTSAAAGDGLWLRLASSASSMWTANAATVAPSADTSDGRVHFVPANLQAMVHRSIEAEQTTRTLRAIFSDDAFVVHEPLPSSAALGDEGAANHTRLVTESGRAHIFGWGRRQFGSFTGPRIHPARQTLEASRAVARMNAVERHALFFQQSPRGIDAGAFHTDVLSIGTGGFLMLHELAFVDVQARLNELRAQLGEQFRYCLARDAELPVADAVGAYPFNSQLVTVADGSMAIVAPKESQDSSPARAFLTRVVEEDNPVSAVHTVDVNGSMKNGGGPACLRLRVELTESERSRISARVFFDADLDRELTAWVERHYRDRLGLEDLADPTLLDETRVALDELTTILGLPSIYPYQR